MGGVQPLHLPAEAGPRGGAPETQHGLIPGRGSGSSSLCPCPSKPWETQRKDGYFLELGFLLPIQVKAIIAHNPLLITHCMLFPSLE